MQTTSTQQPQEFISDADRSAPVFDLTVEGAMAKWVRQAEARYLPTWRLAFCLDAGSPCLGGETSLLGGEVICQDHGAPLRDGEALCPDGEVIPRDSRALCLNSEMFYQDDYDLYQRTKVLCHDRQAYRRDDEAFLKFVPVVVRMGLGQCTERPGSGRVAGDTLWESVGTLMLRIVGDSRQCRITHVAHVQVAMEINLQDIRVHLGRKVIAATRELALHRCLAGGIGAGGAQLSEHFLWTESSYVWGGDHKHERAGIRRALDAQSPWNRGPGYRVWYVMGNADPVMGSQEEPPTTEHAQVGGRSYAIVPDHHHPLRAFRRARFRRQSSMR